MEGVADPKGRYDPLFASPRPTRMLGAMSLVPGMTQGCDHAGVLPIGACLLSSLELLTLSGAKAHMNAIVPATLKNPGEDRFALNSTFLKDSSGDRIVPVSGLCVLDFVGDIEPVDAAEPFVGEILIDRPLVCGNPKDYRLRYGNEYLAGAPVDAIQFYSCGEVDSGGYDDMYGEEDLLGARSDAKKSCLLTEVHHIAVLEFRGDEVAELFNLLSKGRRFRHRFLRQVRGYDEHRRDEKHRDNDRTGKNAFSHRSFSIV